MPRGKGFKSTAEETIESMFGFAESETSPVEEAPIRQKRPYRKRQVAEVHEQPAVMAVPAILIEEEPETPPEKRRYPQLMSCGHFSFWLKEGVCEGCAKKYRRIQNTKEQMT